MSITGPAYFYQPTDIIIQNFSIPINIANYMKKNPSSAKVYTKLLNLCKFFYSKKEFAVPFCDTKQFWPKKGLTWPFRCAMKYSDYKAEFEIENLNFNIWLTNNFIIWNKNVNFTSTFLQKVVRCDIVRLGLFNQTITLDEFLFLSAKVIYFYNSRSVITGKNDKILPVDYIFECCPKIAIFSWQRRRHCDSVFTPEAIQNLSKLVQLSRTLKHLALIRVPRDFNVESILNLIDARPRMEYQFDFRGPLAKNKINQLKSRVKDILASGLTNNPPPVIFYSSQKIKERKAVCALFKKYRGNIDAQHSIYYFIR